MTDEKKKKSRKVTCEICGDEIDRDEAEKLDGQTVCWFCYNTEIEEELFF